MKNILLYILLLFSFTVSGQTIKYEIIKNPKVEQAFTVENIDSLEIQLKKLQHATDTVYYEVSEWTKIKIHPKNAIIGIKEENNQ